jgi:hypothetical protein
MRHVLREQDLAADDDRRTRGLAALALVLFLLLVASYLIQQLNLEAQLEDCLLAQRSDCDALIQKQ